MASCGNSHTSEASWEARPHGLSGRLPKVASELRARRPQKDDVGAGKSLFDFHGKTVDKLFIFEPSCLSDIGGQMLAFIQSGFDIRQILAKSSELLIKLEQILNLFPQGRKSFKNCGQSARM